MAGSFKDTKGTPSLQVGNQLQAIGKEPVYKLKTNCRQFKDTEVKT